MKIVCVGYIHGAGGAERQIIMLANALSERKHEVHMVVLAQYNNKYDINKNVKIHDLSYADMKKGNTIVNRYIELMKVYKTIKPDVTIHFWLQSAYLSAFMSHDVGKIIYAERGDPGDKEYKGILGLIRKITMYKMAGFVFQSEGAREYFNKNIKRKSVIIHNAISVPKDKYLFPCSERKRKIINVGRLHPQKNQELLIRAFARISKNIKGYVLEIYGDGELKDNLSIVANELGVGDRVKIYPSRKDIFDCIYNASLFVLTSDYEGMPNVLMEAMALGVPCISTDCRPGGAKTLIQDGINGYIVAPNDEVALGNKIVEVLNSDTTILEKKAQSIRKNHTIDCIYDQWENFITRIMWEY